MSNDVDSTADWHRTALHATQIFSRSLGLAAEKTWMNQLIADSAKFAIIDHHGGVVVTGLDPYSFVVEDS